LCTLSLTPETTPTTVVATTIASKKHKIPVSLIPTRTSPTQQLVSPGAGGGVGGVLPISSKIPVRTANAEKRAKERDASGNGLTTVIDESQLSPSEIRALR